MFAPNSIIENLLQQKEAQAAMTLDALFAADLHKWPTLDISTILAYLRRSGVGCGEYVIRRGLSVLASKGLLTRRQILTRQKGRPAWKYGLKTVNQMADILKVKLHANEHSDSIPLASFKSARAYRAGKHYSLLARLGTSQLSRKKLGARLGVGGRSTFNYEKGLPIKVTQQVERNKLSKADVLAAPTKKLNANVYLEVKIERDMTEDELRIVYKDFDESYLLICNRKTADFVKMPYTAFILKRELELGHEVYKVKQVTNLYEVA